MKERLPLKILPIILLLIFSLTYPVFTLAEEAEHQGSTESHEVEHSSEHTTSTSTPAINTNVEHSENETHVVVTQPASQQINHDSEHQENESNNPQTQVVQENHETEQTDQTTHSVPTPHVSNGDIEHTQELHDYLDKEVNTTKRSTDFFVVLSQYVPNTEVKFHEVGLAVQQSLNTMHDAENQITHQNFFKRYFFGGDQKSAQKISSEVKKNQTYLDELQNLQESCTNCSDEIKNEMQYHITNLKREQDRLQRLSQDEIDNRSLFHFFSLK